MSDQPLRIMIDLSEIAEFAEVLERAPVIVAEEQRIAMDKSVKVLESAVALETPEGATALLRGSITHDIYGTPAKLTGEVFTPKIYGEPVEYGRRPGKPPPYAPIRLWVIRKLGITDIKEATSAAIAIAKAIGRHGTKGAHMFEKGFSTSEPFMLEIHEQIPANVLEKLSRLQ